MSAHDVPDLAYGDAPDAFDSPDGRTYSAPETAGQAAGVDPQSIGYRVHAHAFNTLTEWLVTDQRFVPLSVRDYIATAIVAAIEPLIRDDERAIAAAAPAPAAEGGLRAGVHALMADLEQSARTTEPSEKSAILWTVAERLGLLLDQS